MMTWMKFKCAVGMGVGAFLVGAATVALSSVSSRETEADSYFLKGTFNYTIRTLSAGGGVKENPPLKREFAVFVKGSTWKIRSRSVGSTNYEYFQTSFDGTNIYYTSKLAANAQVMDSGNRLMVTAGSNLLQTIIIEQAPVPRVLPGPGDCFVWLAFASGGYFKSLTNNTVFDFNLLNSPSAGFMQQTRRQVGCRYTLSSVTPNLPSEAEYADYDYATQGRSSESTNNMILGAKFTSEGFTDFDGFFLPTQFKYEKYFVTRAQNSTSSTLSLTVEGVVSFLSTEDPGWGSDIPNKQVMISDLREPGVPGLGVMYPTTNGILPSLGSTRMIELRKQALDRAKSIH